MRPPYSFDLNIPCRGKLMSLSDLNSLPGRKISILAKDEIPNNYSMSDVLQTQNRKQFDTGGLAMLLKVKVNGRVMVTTNIGLSNKLINGQLGTVKYFPINQNEV